MHRIILAFLISFHILGFVEPPTESRTSFADAQATIPLDPDVITGTLSNGLRFYVRVNDTPEHRAELRLAVNAGSVLEDDDQQGFAHFVEHMAFNGSKHFEKNELIAFLESVGMRFGHDVNAATGMDSTFYMLQIPTDDAPMVQKGFRVLADWAHCLSFDPEEIDKERGVILEEWRMGKGADERMLKKQFPILMHGSKYAERLPIGKRDIIEHGTHQALKRFYRDWYRPNLMAVVAVGDFDADTIIELIEREFGAIPNPENPRPRGEFPIPIHRETLFAIAGDEEATHAVVSLIFKAKARPVDTVQDYRRSLLEDLFLGMFNQRLLERTKQADPAFLYGMASRAGFVREMGGFMVGAYVPETGVQKGYRQLLEDTFRVKKHGFRQSELDRQKKELLRAAQRAFQERETVRSAKYASEYMAHFLMGTPAPSAADELQLAQTLIPGISLREVNALATSSLTDQGRVVLLSMPEKKGISVPTESELGDVLRRMEAATIEPYEDRVVGQKLIEKLPTPGAVAEESSIEGLGVIQWTLANGVTVVIKPTDFKDDEVRMKAFAPGGFSLAEPDRIISARLSDAVVDACGLGDLNAVDLQKVLAGKMLGVSPFMGELFHGLKGWATPTDLEPFFQLIHLHFVGLRKDADAFAALKKKLKSKVANRLASPEVVFKEKLQSVMVRDHPYRQPLTPENLENLDLNQAVDYFSGRFADPSQFTFVFVGDLDAETMRPLVTRYLGSLKKSADGESWKDLGIRPPEGVVRECVVKGTEPKSHVALVFSGDLMWTRENRYRLTSMLDVLRIFLRERLREELGGVYSIGAWDSAEKYPKPQYRVGIHFGCDPKRVDEMVAAAFAVIDDVKQNGVPQETIDKVKQMQLRKWETDVKENLFWLGALHDHFQGIRDARQVVDYAELVTSLNSDIVQAAAKSMLRDDQFVQVVLVPEDNPG